MRTTGYLRIIICDLNNKILIFTCSVPQKSQTYATITYPPKAAYLTDVGFSAGYPVHLCPKASQPHECHGSWALRKQLLCQQILIQRGVSSYIKGLQ